MYDLTEKRRKRRGEKEKENKMMRGVVKSM
jgi:hypothetical protein